jgi:hypothetical protein
MLMGLRLSKVDPVKGAAEFNKAVTNGIMASNSDNFAYPTSFGCSQRKFLVQTSSPASGRNWYAVSKPMVDYMLPLNDSPFTRICK